MEARQQRFMYDNRLSPMSRIYLAEVSHYFGTPVDCKVDDKYFATLFHVNERQVRRWRDELKSFGYIKERYNNFGNKVTDYVAEIDNRVTPQVEMRVIYKTPEGGYLTNTLEAINYFNELVDKQKLAENIKNPFRTFFNVFANCLFNEIYLNIQLNRKITVTQEFLQYMIEHLRFDVVWSTVMRVMERYTEIQNLNLYILTSLATLYQDEFLISTSNPNYKEYRQKQIEELIERAKRLAQENKEDE